MLAREYMFRDLAGMLDSLSKSATHVLTDEKAELLAWRHKEAIVRLRTAVIRGELEPQFVQEVVSELITKLLHSVLVMFEGGTALWEKTSIDIIDANGQSLRGSLNAKFFAYLRETGRMK